MAVCICALLCFVAQIMINRRPYGSLVHQTYCDFAFCKFTHLLNGFGRPMRCGGTSWDAYRWKRMDSGNLAEENFFDERANIVVSSEAQSVDARTERCWTGWRPGSRRMRHVSSFPLQIVTDSGIVSYFICLSTTSNDWVSTKICALSRGVHILSVDFGREIPPPQTH